MPTEAVTRLYAGLDLHKSNVFCGIKDQEGKPIYRRRLPAELPVILEALVPYRGQLEAVAVESTFNWYWLVDGLQAAGLPVRLANPAAMGSTGGLKQTDDESDALWLAEMLRLGILPEGYIYPPAERPVRDMLRRRMLVVRQATQTLLSCNRWWCATPASQSARGSCRTGRCRSCAPRLWIRIRSRRPPRCWSCSAEQRRIQHRLEKQVLAVVNSTGRLCGC